MEIQALQLWCAYPDDASTEDLTQACAPMLSEDEHARWQAFKFDRHAREYLTTRALVRTALSACHPIAPGAWRFDLNAYGKPAPGPECGLCFNLTNAPHLVACLIARGIEVGVDLEPFERAGKIAELAPDVFSPLELGQLAALSDTEKLNRALRLWTLKEAYIKARGMGLALPLNKFSFLFGGREGIHLELDPSVDDEPGYWRFCLLQHAGHSIALMARCGNEAAPELQIWEARPVWVASVRLAAGGEQWFPLSQSAGY